MRYFAILFGLLLLCECGHGFPDAPRMDQGETVATVRAYLDTLEHEGFSGTVLVEFQGKVVISQGYGYSDVQNRRKNSARTIFDIGSITKQFTAAAIMKLEMQGKVSTEDRLPKYFKNVPPDKSEITIHQLLRHSSGLRSNLGGDYEKITEATFVDSLMRSPLRFPPGTAFSYSNIGYSLLGMIVEKVSGMPYEKFLYQNLWHPAGMEQTGYKRPDFDDALIATGYRNDDRAWGKPTEKQWDADGPFWHLKGNGGILSTVEDFFRWNQALLTDRVLSEAAKAKMYHPMLRKGEDSTAYYAYGWDVRKTPRNTTSYWHNGSNGIFYADFYRLVDEHTTVIILTNKSNGFQRAGGEIVRSLFFPTYTPVVPIADNERNRSFTDNVIETTIQQGPEAGANQLAKATKGQRLLEDRVNRKGYELLQDGKAKQAVSVFWINVQAFPESANTYDSLGEAYLAAGDTTLSIENYRRSLALDPENQNAAEVLQRLHGK
ncbi:MAG: serine hydrolase [Bacteroidetes bacterium]|nr:serine hydrolase [Bacteroidota bacterium]